MDIDWIEEIDNPNKPKRTKRKHKKQNEHLPNYLPSNMPVAHTTVEGKGWVSILISRKKNKHEK